MRRYSFSKFRIGLFVFLLAACVFLVGSGFAQTAGGAAGAAPSVPGKTNPFTLVLDNIDFVFIIIALLSVIGVALIIQGVITNRSEVMMPQATTDRIRDMIEQRKFKELLEFTENDPSFISKALHPALMRAPSFSSMKEAMETAVGEQTAEQFRKIEYLNIIGNLGPLLGLLGTVLGMIYAFQGVADAGGVADTSVLSGGISKALCHTMLGLLLAVPCLAAFGVLRTMVDRLTVQGALQSEELLLMIKPQEAKPAAPGVRPTAMPQPALKKAPIPISGSVQTQV